MPPKYLYPYIIFSAVSSSKLPCCTVVYIQVALDKLSISQNNNNTHIYIYILEWGLVEKNKDIDKGVVKYSDKFGFI